MAFVCVVATVVCFAALSLCDCVRVFLVVFVCPCLLDVFVLWFLL